MGALLRLRDGYSTRLDRRASGLLCQRFPADHVLLLVVDDLESLLVQRPLQVMQRDLCRGKQQMQPSSCCGVKVGMSSAAAPARSCSEGGVPFHAVKAVAKELSAMLGTVARTPSEAREDEESACSSLGCRRTAIRNSSTSKDGIYRDQSHVLNASLSREEKANTVKRNLP